MDEARLELNVGDKIGKYVILRQLGRGNVATVYLAEQRSDIPAIYQQMFGRLGIQA